MLDKPTPREALVMIGNLPYPIIERLGYQGGYKAIVVRTSTGAERVAVWRGNNWRWREMRDRLGKDHD